MRKHKQQLSLLKTNKKDIELHGDKSGQGALGMKDELSDDELNAATGGLFLIRGLRGIEWANLGAEGARKLCIS